MHLGCCRYDARPGVDTCLCSIDHRVSCDTAVPFGARAPSGADEAAALGATTAEKAADSRGWDRLLDRLIAAPRNDVFLLQALRQVP